MKSICIIGLGPVGTSFGLALKQTIAGKPDITGFDLKRDRARRAQKAGAINKNARDLPSALKGAELVYIDIPANEIKECLGHAAGSLQGDCIVTDTASTKGQVIKWAEEILPPGISFIGGHPLIGQSISEIETADPNLFKGQTYCLIPARETATGALENMITLVKLIGASPFLIDALEHDAFAAGCEHLPLLLSHVLASVTTRTPAWSEMSGFTTSHYDEFCRPALANHQSIVDICLNNREGIIRWLDEYISELQRLQGLITTESNELAQAIEDAHQAIETKLSEGSSVQKSALSKEEIGGGMTEMMVGRRMASRFQRFWKQDREPEKK
jgi:prephenate dehydrogenase